MRILFAFATLVSISAQPVLAGSIVISKKHSLVNTAQEASGAPAGWIVWELFVTTTGDILSIGNVTTTNTYNDPLGEDTKESPFANVPGFERLQVDSWITTPSANTAILGGDGALDGDGTESWTDLTNDGPQANFLFARLTIDSFNNPDIISGRIAIAGASAPESFPFSIIAPLTLYPPEPNTLLLAGMGLIGLTTFRRRPLQLKS